MVRKLTVWAVTPGVARSMRNLWGDGTRQSNLQQSFERVGEMRPAPLREEEWRTIHVESSAAGFGTDLGRFDGAGRPRRTAKPSVGRLHQGPAESKRGRFLGDVRLSCCDWVRCRIHALKSRSRPHWGDAPCITPMSWPGESRAINSEMDEAYLKGAPISHRVGLAGRLASAPKFCTLDGS